MVTNQKIQSPSIQVDEWYENLIKIADWVAEDSEHSRTGGTNAANHSDVSVLSPRVSLFFDNVTRTIHAAKVERSDSEVS